MDTVDIHGCFFGIAGYLPDYSTNTARGTLDHVTLRDNRDVRSTTPPVVVNTTCGHEPPGRRAGHVGRLCERLKRGAHRR